MSGPKTLGILVVLTAAAVAAAYLTKQGSDDIPMSGKPVLPGLFDAVNDVRKVSIASGGERFVVERKDDVWVLPAREGYRADEGQVRQLLVGMAALTRVEPKTANPELYAKVGLGDPMQAESATDATAYALEDGSGKAVASLTVGNRRGARGDPRLEEFYVLVGDDPQVWLVQGSLPQGSSLAEWIDDSLMGIEPERVARMRVEHPDGEVVTVARDEPWAEDFTLVGQPEGTEIEDKWQVDDIGRGIARLTFDDVSSGTLAASGKVPAFEAEMTTHDGMRVRMTAMYGEPEAAPGGDAGASSGAGSPDAEAPERPLYAVLEAEFDESLVNQAFIEEMKTTPKDEIEAMAAGDERRRAQALGKLVDPEQVQAEVEAANARWSGWVYRLPEFKGRHLGRKMADLVKPAEPQAPVEGPQPEPGSS